MAPGIQEFTKNLSGSYNTTASVTIAAGAGAHNIAFGPDGDIYASFFSGYIEKFSPTGTDLGTFASGFTGGLTGIAVAPSGVVYVGEYYNGDVLRISANGLSSSVFSASTPAADGISLVTPEPSTITLAAIGAIGSLLAVRRRRHPKR